MFGFKKRTVEEILSAIEKLSDEDREKLRSALNGEMPQEQEEPDIVQENDGLYKNISKRSDIQDNTTSQNNISQNKKESIYSTLFTK